MEIQIQESIFEENRRNAQALNRRLTESRIFTLNVLGSPGSGKTTALLHLCPLLDRPVSVIEGDIASELDTLRIRAAGLRAVQINTGGECHLDTPAVTEALDRLGAEPGYLFVENIGNLVCPAAFMIGEHAKILVSSVAEGTDKPYKYPSSFACADMILLTKCDLAEAVGFDFDDYLSGVRQCNAHAPVIRVSTQTGGFEEASAWLMARAAASVTW